MLEQIHYERSWCQTKDFGLDTKFHGALQVLMRASTKTRHGFRHKPEWQRKAELLPGVPGQTSPEYIHTMSKFIGANCILETVCIPCWVQPLWSYAAAAIFAPVLNKSHLSLCVPWHGKDQEALVQNEPKEPEGHRTRYFTIPRKGWQDLKGW
jgi:hypothetical protein